MRKHVLRTAGVIAVLLALIVGCSNKSDISGKWKGMMTLAETGKSISDLEFAFDQKGRSISGVMSFTRVGGGKMKLNGTLSGDELTFTTEHAPGLTVSFTGTVKSGSFIAGTAVLSYSDPKVPVKEDKVTMELTR